MEDKVYIVNAYNENGLLVNKEAFSTKTAAENYKVWLYNNSDNYGEIEEIGIPTPSENREFAKSIPYYNVVIEAKLNTKNEIIEINIGTAPSRHTNSRDKAISYCDWTREGNDEEDYSFINKIFLQRELEEKYLKTTEADWITFFLEEINKYYPNVSISRGNY